MIKKLQALLSPYALGAPNDYFLYPFYNKMRREIAVARKSYPASNFAPSHN